MPQILLPDRNGKTTIYRLTEPQPPGQPVDTAFNRVVYSAAHVVADPYNCRDPYSDNCIDWEATMEFRRYLWRLGLGVAEAMDTAQRGMGLNWPAALELISRSLEAARDFSNPVLACGVGTDHLNAGEARSIDDVISAYEMQCMEVEKLGGRLILMASRELARVAATPDHYARVYERILAQVKQPVIIHWLGEGFDPALAGYWGSRGVASAMTTCLEIIHQNSDKIDGIKISLLDKELEIQMRRRLPAGVKMYTGDDFNYPELIGGDSQGYSHALLGIFGAIAPIASTALANLGRGDEAGFRDLLEPTVPLSRHMFRAPTRFYKTGVVFLAYLNGHQSHFTMLGAQQGARSLMHLVDLFKLADRAGALTDPELAVYRLQNLLKLYGVEK